MSVVHAPSPQPFHDLTADPLAKHGRAVDRRTACKPYGAMIAGTPATYTVAIGDDRWDRVTCKACLR